MTVERKAPTAASTSPISSGCWCPCAFLAARFFLRTRAGVRGLRRRFLRRRGIGRTSFDVAGRSPFASGFSGGIGAAGRRKLLGGEGAQIVERAAEQVLA